MEGDNDHAVFLFFFWLFFLVLVVCRLCITSTVSSISPKNKGKKFVPLYPPTTHSLHYLVFFPNRILGPWLPTR